jgi:hypothetical protein
VFGPVLDPVLVGSVPPEIVPDGASLPANVYVEVHEGPSDPAVDWVGKPEPVVVPPCPLAEPTAVAKKLEYDIFHVDIDARILDGIGAIVTCTLEQEEVALSMSGMYPSATGRLRAS